MTDAEFDILKQKAMERIMSHVDDMIRPMLMLDMLRYDGIIFYYSN